MRDFEVIATFFGVRVAHPSPTLSPKRGEGVNPFSPSVFKRFYANYRPNSIVVLMVADVQTQISPTKRRMPKWDRAVGSHR